MLKQVPQFSAPSLGNQALVRRCEMPRGAPVLTDRDWVEIYYALESKCDLFVGDDQEWIGHLKNIMASIRTWCDENEITL